jgi:hypothetical protein
VWLRRAFVARCTVGCYGGRYALRLLDCAEPLRLRGELLAESCTDGADLLDGRSDHSAELIELLYAAPVGGVALALARRGAVGKARGERGPVGLELAPHFRDPRVLRLQARPCAPRPVGDCRELCAHGCDES